MECVGRRDIEVGNRHGPPATDFDPLVTLRDMGVSKLVILRHSIARSIAAATVAMRGVEDALGHGRYPVGRSVRILSESGQVSRIE
jgi:hypothetical protein